MTLSWNEIRDRAFKFSQDWKKETRENAESQTFWNEFFQVFGISRRRVATFEEPVRMLNNNQGSVDLFWKGTLLVEHKSLGKNLDAAFNQALDYFHGIKEHELPKYVLVSDFKRFRLYDLDDGKEYKFTIDQFHEHINLFGFIAGYQKRAYKKEDPVNITAAESLGKLHDLLKDSKYDTHALEAFLVRILFCLFADDSRIFETGIFQQYIETRTNEDGSSLGAQLSDLFQVLNTPRGERQKNIDENLDKFDYINGRLFQEVLKIPTFDSKMRSILLECCHLNWNSISPAIFGSMFQSVMSPEKRRNIGAHYTSEENILKLISPLFLDDLKDEFNKVKNNVHKLKKFHQKLRFLTFLDPACGCGNFLVITYREIRLLEIEILKVLYNTDQQWSDISHIVWVDVDQFYGIEYEEWPAKIAEVALWLMDHQMNMKISEEFGNYFARIPLKKTATIIYENALRIDWETVIPKNKLSYILGNPPFYGKHLQNKEQKEDIKLVFNGIKGSGVLDYVTAWYLKSAQYVQGTHIKVGFVSTNSITQGEQTGILWYELFNNYGIKIHFAHKTFIWKNAATGNAAVHVIIIGFANFDTKLKKLWSYENINSEPHEQIVKNINPYLVGSNDIVVLKRTKPLNNVPPLLYGNKIVDEGNLLFNDKEKIEFLRNEPKARKFIKQILSGEEYINGKKRWVLYLNDASPKKLRSMPLVLDRIKKVKEFRSASTKAQTREASNYPHLFAESRQPKSNFLIIPRTSSENRRYIPFGFFDTSYIVNDSCTALPDAKKYHFGILTSIMHMSWVKCVCGRLKSDYRYSNSIVYNNFPWPENFSEKKKKSVEEKAQKVLDARTQFPESSLADLYDPLTMPSILRKAHNGLDKAVDRCYRPQPFTSDDSRIEYLFNLYDKYTNRVLETSL